MSRLRLGFRTLRTLGGMGRFQRQLSTKPLIERRRCDAEGVIVVPKIQPRSVLLPIVGAETGLGLVLRKALFHVDDQVLRQRQVGLLADDAANHSDHLLGERERRNGGRWLRHRLWRAFQQVGLSATERRTWRSEVQQVREVLLWGCEVWAPR